MSRYLSIGIVLLLISWAAFGYAADDAAGVEQQLTVHESIACAKCHKLNASVSVVTNRVENNRSCLSCHNDKDSKSSEEAITISWASLFHDDPARPCADCHSFHNPKVISIDNQEFTVSDDELTAYVCQTCHLPGQPIEMVSAGHRRAAADFYHVDNVIVIGDSPSNSCLKCHSEHGLGSSDQSEKPIVISVAASHAFGVDVRVLSANKRVREIEDKIRLYNNKVECQSCHTLSSGRADELVAYENQNDLCYGCHTTRG